MISACISRQPMGSKIGGCMQVCFKTWINQSLIHHENFGAQNYEPQIKFGLLDNCYKDQ